MKLSIVIPAKNEGTRLTTTLQSIRSACEHARCESEIIVVDNNSIDNTKLLAEKFADITITSSENTVGALRNEGVQICSGELIVFLDADIELTAAWAQNINEAATYALENKSICGSFVSPPISSNTFLKYWFKHLGRANGKYLGSAHMILSKYTFEATGGFERTLISGEDYDLCQRASALGFEIKVFPNLEVIHHGFPTTAGAFVRREWWHGSGDTIHSKIRIFATVFLLLHFVLVAGIIFKNVPMITMGTLTIALQCMSFSKMKFLHQGMKVILVNSFISYLYCVGRSLSLIYPRNRGKKKA